MAIQRVCKLFGAEHANVQPHSGASANEIVYLAALNPGDTVLAMSLNSGGHISHMSKATGWSKFYNAYYYDVDKENYLLDYDKILELALEIKPKLIIAGASAYPRNIDFSKLEKLQIK